jgi:hypothetical protein
MQVIEEACDGATEWISRHPVGPLPAIDEVMSSDDENNIPLNVVAGRVSQATADSESDDDRPLSEYASQPRQH